MTIPGAASIPGVCDVIAVDGARTLADAPVDLLLEVPHGATRAEDFEAVARRLRGPLLPDLRDFFFVNTDVGAPEVALALARHVTRAEPSRRALVVRARVPRTFVDLNRVLPAEASASPHRPGEMTPGLPPYVRDPQDRAFLRDVHAAYADLVERLFERVCGHGGTAFMVHSYAPRSVDVAVDDDIVASLRAAYRPERRDAWPLRPPVDLITTTPQGARLADPALVDRLVAGFAAEGLEAATAKSYALDPSSMAHRYAARYPGRTLCFEVRRDLLVPEFTPFAEMAVDAAKVDRVAAVIARALAPAPAAR